MHIHLNKHRLVPAWQILFSLPKKYSKTLVQKKVT